MKKIINKLIIIVLVICLSSCQVVYYYVGKEIVNSLVDEIKNNDVIDDEDYTDDFHYFLNVINNYVVRDKNFNNTIINEEFEDFLHEEVVKIYESSYTSTHFDFIDYKSFGIEKPEVSWGDVIVDKEEIIQDHIDILNKLYLFDYNSLSYRQQFDYESLEYSLYEDLVSLTADFSEELLFNSKNDLLGSVINILSDFSFYDQESIDDYMLLLDDTDRYIDDAIAYSKSLAEEYDYYLIDYSIDICEDYIDSFVGANPNALVISFNNRLDNLDFDIKEDVENYKKQNKKIVEEEIVPAFLRVKDFVEGQRGKTTPENNRLINISEEYADSVYLLDISYNKPIDEIFDNSCSVLRSLINEYINLSSDPTVIEELESLKRKEVSPLDEDFDGMLQFLEKNYTKTNPDLGYIEYDLSAVEESIASSSVIAYYWSSPIDKPEQNIIKYNLNSIDDGESWEAYFTIAHEGIPGHMYDYYRSLKNNDNPIRRAITYNGVVEGYALYSEICASKYLDVSEKTQRYLAIDVVSGYILDGILDIAINYFDYSDDNLKSLIGSLGYNIEDLSFFKNFFADMYGSLCRYGIGVANILMIKEDVKERLGYKFDEIEFNDMLTKYGRLPLVIIEQEINKYVNQKLR